MDVLRTPEDRFADLEDYPFAPNHHAFEGVRMHYVDEGPRDGPVVLMAHGMPTWSYLYRRMIPPLVRAGYRCVAPDMIGFGKSDKVLDDGWYSIERHCRSLRSLVEALDLQRVSLIVQDWGGPLGLYQPAHMPERFERLFVLNTWLENPEFEFSLFARVWNAVWHPHDTTGGPRTRDPNLLRRAFVQVARRLFVRFALKGDPQPCGAVAELIMMADYPGAKPDLGPKLYAAYEAPFPDDKSKAGARRFPLSLPFWNPASGDAEGQRRNWETLLGWKKPVHFIWGLKDTNFNQPWLERWAAHYPQATIDRIADGGHFLQETHGPQLAQRMLERIAEEAA
ncbi:MAG: haloalkane dehalogenase [Myxococcota bacterium]